MSTEFPKALSHKKAQAWIAAHPEADAYRFWMDQSRKHLDISGRFLNTALVFLCIAFCAVVASMVGHIIGAF